MVLGFVIGFIIGFVGGFTGIPRPIYIAASVVLGPIIVWPVITAQMLRKNFKGFHITIVREPDTLQATGPSS